jgi:hypothetical protein
MLEAPAFPAGPVDLVLSRISWCFHYPYDAYRDKAHAVLRPRGKLIVVCRNG